MADIHNWEVYKIYSMINPIKKHEETENFENWVQLAELQENAVASADVGGSSSSQLAAISPPEWSIHLRAGRNHIQTTFATTQLQFVDSLCTYLSHIAVE